MKKAKPGRFGKIALVLALSISSAFPMAIGLIPLWNAKRFQRHLETVSPLATIGESDPWPIDLARRLAERWKPYGNYWDWCLTRARERAAPYSPQEP